MQHRLKTQARAARAQIVAPQLFSQVFIAMDDPVTFFDVGFRGESSAAFTGPLERRIGWRFRLRISRHTSCRLQSRLPWAQSQSHLCDHFRQDVSSFVEKRLVSACQRIDLPDQRANPPPAAFKKQPLAGRRRRKKNAAAILGVLFSDNKSLLFESADDACHGWRAHLLGRGKVAKCNRASEHDHRKSRETRRIQ